ncbi:hypothetical protein [Polyangium fumosum]|uniref:Peptidase S8/S53 domain-containing protein n=1 Tax=Polyangium fumosum TaxID=889272 RepID=A0A4U1JBQ9_9BACT|nr:hypothetical protein [Polyangium fumosum]TKD05047.1 hypothetical protein E8A74_22545 [Polyangium fumosum]
MAGGTSTPTAGCAGLRWVGLSTTGACPMPPPGWVGGPAFGVPAGSPPLPPYLADYCLYSWTAPGLPAAADVNNLGVQLAGAGVLGLAEDCVVVGPLADGFSDASREWLHAEYMSRMGSFGPLTFGSKRPAEVRIALADSSPDDTAGTLPLGTLDHGYLLGWLAKDLACPAGGPCAARVTTELALPRIDAEKADFTKGGLVGTRLDLARAIVMAVERWKKDRADHLLLGAGVDHPRLVVNLSVGWEPALGCDSNPASNAVSASVYDALVHAHCHGAAVIAAAGNDRGGPSPPHGLVCPAAWTVDAGPTSGTCTSLEGTGYTNAFAGGLPLFPPGREPPLVHAVGGLEYADRPIARTRPEGMPPLAALALQGVAAGPSRPFPAPRTGTSLGAAAVSAIAAAAWAYRPSLSAGELLELVYASGERTNLVADVPSPAEVKRPSLCAAIAAVCSLGNNAACPPGLACAPIPPRFDQNPPLFPGGLALLDAAFEDAPAFVAPPPSDDPAPSEQVPSLAIPPWVRPQPDSPPCGSCVIHFGSVHDPAWLVVELDSRYGRELTDMSLILSGVTPAGTLARVTVGPLGPAQMNGLTGPFRVTGIQRSSLARVSSAVLSWQSTDPVTGEVGSVSEQILISD